LAAAPLAPPGFGWRAAIERAGGAWLGFIGLNHARPEAIELRSGDVELGWWLVPAVWGRGLATEGAAAVRDEAFGRLGLERVVARCGADNPASARVMEKIGMHRDRVATGRHGEPMLIYVLDRPGARRDIG
jgi:RimJ/RimL family protein N-acetyltransferase